MRDLRPAFSILACTIFVSFWLLTLVYASPVEWGKGKIRSAANLMIGPFFHQDWRLFAPEPPISSQHFLYQCTFADGTQSEWIDPGLPMLERHHGNRFSYHGKEFNIYEGIARNLRLTSQRNSELWSEPERFNELMQSRPSYILAVRYASDKAAAQFPDREIAEVDLRVEYWSVPQYSDRATTTDWQVVHMDFPTASWQKTENR